MDAASLATFRTLADINKALSQANTLDDALKTCLRIIQHNLEAEMAVIWYLRQGW